MSNNGMIVVVSLTIYVIAQTICYVFRIGIKKYSRYFYIMFVAGLSVLTFHLVPGPTYDLYRYFVFIQEYGSGSATDLFYRNEYVTSGAIIWMAICRVVAALENQYFLPAIVIFLFYIMVGKIITLSNCLVTLSRRVIILYFLIANATMVLIDIFSGLRYPLAYIFAAFAYILLCDVNSNKWKIIIFLIIAQMIHPSAMVFIIVALLAGYKNFGKYKKAIMASWSLLGMLIIQILQKFSINFFQYYAKKMISYYRGEIPDWRPYAVKICFIVFFICMYMYVNRKGEGFSNAEKKYLYYYSCILCFTIGSIAISELFERLVGFVGFLSLPLLGMCYLINKRVFIIYIIICTPLVISLYAYSIIGMSHSMSFI